MSIKCGPCWRYNPGAKDVLFLWLIASKLEGGFEKRAQGALILLEYPIRARLKNAIRIKIEETIARQTLKPILCGSILWIDFHTCVRFSPISVPLFGGGHKKK